VNLVVAVGVVGESDVGDDDFQEEKATETRMSQLFGPSSESFTNQPQHNSR
jgi:hypothetical protein